MKWMVEITDVSLHKRLLTDVLKSLKVELYQEDNIIYLVSDRFETQLTNFEIWKLAEKMRDRISEVASNFGMNINFKLGNLYEQREDGSRNKHTFIFGSLVLPMTEISGSLTVIPAQEISKEDKARLEAERQESEYQEKLALVSCHVLSAFQDERVLKAQRFLQQDLTPVRMYHIYELIRDDLGGKLNSLASKKDWIRFTHSVNHQDVFGDASRHIASNEKPPSNPMSLEEAQAFISRVSDLWFKQKCIDKSNPK
jgi:hypothetical protein